MGFVIFALWFLGIVKGLYAVGNLLELDLVSALIRTGWAWILIFAAVKLAEAYQ